MSYEFISQIEHLSRESPQIICLHIRSWEVDSLECPLMESSLHPCGLFSLYFSSFSVVVVSVIASATNFLLASTSLANSYFISFAFLISYDFPIFPQRA